MKDNNKRVFLGIIVIATLVIAIIGGTFAFFSASGGSANNAITANATTLANLGFTSSHSKVATNLVPVASENPYFYRYPGVSSSGEHSCLDDVGNEICSIYEFTVTNTASVAQTIYVSFVPSQNTFDNMYFAAFNTSIASASYVVATGSNGSGNNFSLTPETTNGNSTLGHQATKLTKNSTTPIDMPGLSTSLGAGESITYTILVWLQETGSDQNTEQGGAFKAGVNVTTGGNATGVTGVMGESGNYVYTIPADNLTIDIGKAIPSGTPIYSTSSSAMAANNKTYCFKQKIGNFSGYCAHQKVGGSETGEYYCVGSLSDCENYSSVMFESSGSYYTYECRYREVNDAVIENYIEFMITPETVLSQHDNYVLYSCNNDQECIASYRDMVAGSYTLFANKNSTMYSTNLSTLQTAFGSNVSENTNIFDFHTDVWGVGFPYAYGLVNNDIQLGDLDWDCYVSMNGNIWCQINPW